MSMSQDRKEKTLDEIAERHDVSFEAVELLYQRMSSGRGTLAQFNHPDLGGMGQWTKGGMLMIGDMFNNELKAKVASICSDVAALVGQGSDDRKPMSKRAHVDPEGELSNYRLRETWWPEGLGQPSSTGSQNTLRYAFFPETYRLAVADGSSVTVYDTNDHRIGGVSQQQSSKQTLRFTSQHGVVDITELDIVTKLD